MAQWACLCDDSYEKETEGNVQNIGKLNHLLLLTWRAQESSSRARAISTYTQWTVSYALAWNIFRKMQHQMHPAPNNITKYVILLSLAVRKCNIFIG